MEERYAPYLSFLGLPEDLRPTSGPKIGILPLPYDLTTSYQPGARRGPIAILEASTHLETYDEELQWDPSTALQLDTLAPVIPETSGPEATMQRMYAVASEALKTHDFLVGLGGEHSVSFPLVKALREKHPRMGVLQLDAHADLRESFEGSPYNHACVMKRILNLGIPIAQVGIRSLTADEHKIIQSGMVTTVFAAEAVSKPVSQFLPKIVGALPEEVYITVDLDAFDPAIMPATGTPEPGGLTWYGALEILKGVAQSKRIVGFDVVELAPLPGLVAPDFFAAKLVYKLLAYAFARLRSS